MDRFKNHLKQAVCPEIWKKDWPGRARAKILYFVSDRAGLGQKLQFLFRAGPAQSRDFFLYFGPGRAEVEAVQAGPEKSGPCRPLVWLLVTLHICDKQLYSFNQ